ncbi:hypothetical protein [Brevibacillus dissolubilis]|uniref:hypothetical protein n=1 Tax=Brevibacillus dissolubilis TaxID=1844116 RepID=UPI0021003057|nr:hypothetical protein [Brevibacillus dissolubilis]
MARGFFTDIMDEMRDVGYLSPELRAYYQAEMEQMGWGQADGDFFAGSSPQAGSERARKNLQEHVSLVLTVQPTRVSSWIHLFWAGESHFRFAASQPSEYFETGW